VGSRSTLRLAWVASSVAALLLSSGGFVAARGKKTQTHAKSAQAPIDFHAAKTIGTKSAPITLEVFSDFQCPSCKAFFLTATQQIIRDYVSTGKVFLVHHDFPLTMHAHSMEAAKWANAAAGIGKFQEVETALYSTQDSWEATGKVEDAVAAVLSPADLKRAQALIDKPEIKTSIDEDMNLGTQRGINETPSIFTTYKGQMTQIPARGATYGFLKLYFDHLLSQ
jgi:protein-disulfide isomerase